MTGELLVTPEKLEETANSFETLHGKVNSTIQNMMDIVNNLSGKWEGEASSAYSGQFRKLDNDMTQLRNMIKEHVSDLREMASTYRKAETDNVTASNALPVDSIS